MLISVRKRFVFVANSKAGSTSIERALLGHAEIERFGNPERKHIFMRDALREYAFLFGQPGFEPESFFRFGVMRDPLDWIGSWFRYRRGNKVDAPLPEGMDFVQFWQRKDWTFVKPDGTPRLQRDFFTGRDGTLLVDYLIPFDKLDLHFPRICTRLGIKADLKRLNVSREPASQLEIPEALREELRAYYDRDLKLIARLPGINARGLEKLKARAPGGAPPATGGAQEGL